MKILSSLILLLIVGCSTLPNSKKVKTPHGFFTYYLAGSNKPTVIFESGLGDDMTSWGSVINQVSKVSEVFAYNRAGFNGSRSKNITRHAEVITSELKDLLKSVNLSPPYILVGHSVGGAYMELYAKTYPEEVAGVVLVDPNSSKYPAQCKLQRLDNCDPPNGMPTWATLIFPPAVEGEILGFGSTHTQVNAIESFPDVPLVVLSATNKNTKQTDKEKRATELYVQMHKNLAKLSTTSKFVACDTCGHYIHKEEPNLVTSAILWVLEQAILTENEPTTE